ncbi:MAG: DNA repair protein RecO [Clostridiales bacterium]|jgi:DNA repair protein RecO (recombination protein O)|nr:DNA repair protein RecO [Clostridiales bacterium]
MGRLMGHETVTGLISRAVSSRDADRYLTILTAEQGKLECYAKGIRSQKSKLAPSAGLLTFGEYKLFRRGERYILTSGKPIEAFYGIREDIARYACAAHMLEIALDVMPPAQPFPEALQALLNSLFVLANRDAPPEFVARVFEIRILALSGFAPQLDRCSVCGRPMAEREQGYFNACGYGLVCGGEGCLLAAGGKAVPISRGAVRALAHVAECEPGAIFSFSLSDAVLRELSAAVPEYLQYHFGKAYEKLGEAQRYAAFEQEAAYMISRLGARGQAER